MSFPLPWSSLRNPVLYLPTAPLKDAAVVFDEQSEKFYLRASYFNLFESQDLRTWKEMPSSFEGSSPDIIKRDFWYITTQNKYKNKLLSLLPFRYLTISKRESLYSRSKLDATYLGPKFLLPARIIDGALAFDNFLERFILIFKKWQAVYIALSKNFDPSAWERPKKAYFEGGWGENFQILKIDDHWRLIATCRDPDKPNVTGYTESHLPFIFNRGPSWLDWKNKTLLHIPAESWNSVMKANSGFLCDWRKYDGYFYLFYAGSDDNYKFDGRGHAKIGVARSKDLETWLLPGQL